MTETKRRHVGLVSAVLAMAAGTAGAIAMLGAPPAEAVTPATQQIIVRPVDSHRHAVKGYRVKVENRSVACSTPSAAAIDYGILFCGSSADYTVSCWHAADPHRVLCLPDPTTKRLESIRLIGTFPKLRPVAHPSPQALRLRVGSYYVVRDGGAGPMLRHHPSWVSQYYGVDNGRFVGGPRHTDGINRRHATWFVTTFRTPNQQGLRQNVATAYYVGTAS